MTLKKKRYLIISVGIGLLLVYFWGGILPLFKGIEGQIRELEELQQNLANLESEMKGLQTFKSKYRNAQEIQAIKNFFIDPDLPIGFVSFLEKTAKAQEINLEVSSLASIPRKEEAPSLRFLLRGEGLFPNFYSFLSQLEKAPYLIEIDGLNIQRGKKEEFSVSKVNAILSLKVYAQYPPLIYR